MQQEATKKLMTEVKNEVKPAPNKKPNEQSGVYYSSSIKISDPDTGKVLLHVRGD